MYIVEEGREDVGVEELNGQQISTPLLPGHTDRLTMNSTKNT